MICCLYAALLVAAAWADHLLASVSDKTTMCSSLGGWGTHNQSRGECVQGKQDRSCNAGTKKAGCRKQSKLQPTPQRPYLMAILLAPLCPLCSMHVISPLTIPCATTAMLLTSCHSLFLAMQSPGSVVVTATYIDFVEIRARIKQEDFVGFTSAPFAAKRSQVCRL